jgi:AAA domain
MTLPRVEPFTQADIDAAFAGKPDSHSLRPPKGERKGNEYRDQISIVSIADLGPSEPPDWIWPGYIARGSITLLVGLWKAGKTTLLSHLLRDISRGGGLVGDRMDTPTLVLSEEPPGLWARRREDLGLPPSVHFLQSESFAKPQPYEWRILVEYITEKVTERGYGLVVIDTLASSWPVMNENDASEMMEALVPLRKIAATGAGLLLIHHPRKGDGSQGTAARGSGALPGFVEVILELRRYAPDDNADRRRVLTALSRFEETQAEQVIELTDDGYKGIGDRSDAAHEDFDEVIRDTLPIGGWGITFEELLKDWPTDKRPGKSKLRGLLNAGANRGEWCRRGMGNKGDPHRFHIHDPDDADSFQPSQPLGVGANETNTNGQKTLELQRVLSRGDAPSGHEAYWGA